MSLLGAAYQPLFLHLDHCAVHVPDCAPARLRVRDGGDAGESADSAGQGAVVREQ